MNEDSVTLAAAARDGDHRAFAALVEMYWLRLAQAARSIVGPADADDAAQEGLINAWRKIKRLRDPANFEAWIYQIVIRRALRGTSWRRKFLLDGLIRGREHTPDPSQAVDIWRILSRLSPRQRAVLHLTLAEGMTDSEIADILGIAAGSVRSHRRKALLRAEELTREDRS